jgi:UV DNA damage endonuclease
MKIRFGYVAIALNLPKVTSSSLVTYRHYSSLSEIDRINKLKKVTSSNLEDLKKILDYNIKNNIHFYRITSALVPLANHPDVKDWTYRKMFSPDFKIIGDIIKENNIRVDTHPDQYNVINSVKENVVENTKKNLMTHVDLFNDLGYELGKMVIHVGSGQGGKEKAIERFINNFREYPESIKSKIILENDDKVFNIIDVLHICNELNIPMVLDVHHYKCNNDGEDLYDHIGDIFETWDKEELPPKIHFSTPKESEFDRKHSDYIEPNSLIEFVEKVKFINKDFDIMIEAKKKDLALFKLMEAIKSIKPEWKYIDESTIEI